MKHLKKQPVHMKYPKHLNLAKGGPVVQKFADGGAAKPIAVNGGAISDPAQLNPIGGVSGPLASATTQQQPAHPDVAQGIQQSTWNTPGSAYAGQLVGNSLAGVGSIAQGVAQDFTAQNNFQATGAPITAGTNADQLNSAYNGVQGGLNQQQNLANTLTPGVAQGAQTQANLTNTLQGIVNGTGPNPAQAQLNQNTGQNVAAQAALMAGQRGSSANAGLIARQAAQQGAATQQQAVGQGATLQAQQQIAAAQNLQNLAANQVAQGSTAIQGVNNAQQNEQNILQNANSAFNNAQIAQQSNLNSINAGVAQQNAAANNQTLGGLLGGASAVASLFADGGPVGEQTSAPESYAGQWISSAPEASSAPAMTAAPAAPASSDNSKTISSGISGLAKNLASGGRVSGPHQSHVANFLAAGGKTGDVKAIVSPKEVYLGPDQVRKVLHEGADPMKIGHHFPGQDKVKGRDSKKNDVIPTTLKSGGCVVPVHITTHKDASNKSRKFVKRVMAKHMKRPAGA